MARKLNSLSVLRTEQLTEHIVRVFLGGPEWSNFVASEFTDSYVKLIFLRPEVKYPEPLDMEEVAREYAPEQQPILRTYTIRSVNPQRRELAIDFVVHGDLGIAGPWAMKVQPGEVVHFFGPNGAYRPNPDAHWHLFAGDESAIPAISAAVEALPDDAVAKVFIEVADRHDEIYMETMAVVDVTWVHRGVSSGDADDTCSGDNAPLIEAVKNTEWLPGQVQVFIHGEAQAVMHNLRPYIRKERGVQARWASISGYWRRGHTEESFRQWKVELAAAEKHAKE
ncbi:MAG: siderophore-interacting protein [Mycobacteriaceae bacterium]